MKKRVSACCVDNKNRGSSFLVESIVTIDERGQMVLPKEVREKMKIAPGDKLAIVIMEKSGIACCAMMLKTQELAGMVEGFLGETAIFSDGKKK
jgi:AbrB family looped-hinge helix DNA binding protein